MSRGRSQGLACISHRFPQVSTARPRFDSHFLIFRRRSDLTQFFSDDIKSLSVSPVTEMGHSAPKETDLFQKLHEYILEIGVIASTALFATKILVAEVRDLLRRR